MATPMLGVACGRAAHLGHVVIHDFGLSHQCKLVDLKNELCLMQRKSLSVEITNIKPLMSGNFARYIHFKKAYMYDLKKIMLVIFLCGLSPMVYAQSEDMMHKHRQLMQSMLEMMNDHMPAISSP